MTTIYGQTTTSTSALAASDLRSPDQTLPPFRALDELDVCIGELDQWIASFIGRLTPYMVSDPTALRSADVAPAPVRSALENRIYEAGGRLRAIREALDDMNANLAL